MAKIKISELAFELGCESKELIAFLQEKGIEAKRSNSSIEETDAEVAKKHFGKGAKKAETKEEPAKEEKKAKEPVKEEKAPEAKEAPAAPKKPVEGKSAEGRQTDAKPVKKPAEGAEAEIFSGSITIAVSEEDCESAILADSPLRLIPYNSLLVVLIAKRLYASYISRL